MLENQGWFDLASHLGMSLNEVQEKHSERQLKLWMLYLQRQWNRPNRTDHYLMQVAALVRDQNKKRGQAPTKIGQLLITFGMNKLFKSNKPEEAQPTPEIDKVLEQDAKNKKKLMEEKNVWNMIFAKSIKHGNRKTNS